MWMTAGNRTSSSTSATSSDFTHLDDVDEDAVDPRVQEELEKLNNSTDAINKLEVDLDDARAAFRQLLGESSQRLNSLAKKLGSCVDKSRPYYEAKVKEKKAHAETQKAALRFERANSALAVAKEMVFSAEERLQKDRCTFDPAWQEMLNHATIRVNEAERERNSSEQEHKRTSTIYNESEQLVKTLKKELRNNITKARPYFEMKAQFNKKMEEKKRQVEELEENVLKSKVTYAEALHNLEEISDEIHQRRKANEERRALGTRGSGVGAENPEPANNYEVVAKIEDKNLETGKKDASEWPNRMQIYKSRSSSTLYQKAESLNRNDESADEDDKFESRYMNRLRKSKSVMERTRAGPLFGRYSVSRNSKLQVDHACQTEEVVLKPTNGQLNNIITLKKISATINLNVEENSLKPLIGATLSPTRSTTQVSSSTSTDSIHQDCYINEPNSPKLGDEYDPSDSESHLSGDGLTDDQIASLMLDMELDRAAQAITQVEKAIKNSNNYGVQHQTTQTASTMVNDNESISLN